ncbi:MAG: DUF1080 domain-containing protein, partial [Planctomycetaceae bacterium]|nr:DUF1080 domain-containing protein [Planctomycetaceae bacterium]
WENLFDGQTAVDWETLGPFAVKDGLLVASSSGLAVTQKSYSDFDLEFEWRLTPGGNSGVYYRADAAAAGGIAAYPGTEYQLLDNAGHTDGNNPKTSAGALYGVLPASNDFTRPVGDWNASRITARGGHVEHWMNGQRIVTYDMESPEWKNALTEAKNPQIRTNVSRLSGQIMLQGHSGEIAFRKIRVRQFDVRSAATSGVRDALRFQGNPIKDYVELPPAIRFDDQQPGAAELWIERRQATRGTVMMLVGDGQLLYLQLTRGNKAQLVVVPKQQSESLSKAFHFSGGELPPGRIHLAASWNGKGGYHYYVNGTSYSSGQEHVFQFNEFRTSTIGVVSDEPQAPEPQFIDISQVRISTLDRYPKKFVPEQDLNADSDTLALYDFSQGSGDVLKDASGHGHDGKIIGANWVQTGEANEAQSPARQAGLHFDGVDDYVHVPSLEFTGAPLTMEAWITPDRDAWRDGGSGIIGWDWRARLSLDTRNGETGQSLFGQVWSPDKKATTTPTLHWGERSPGGQLRHVAMVINSDEFQLFQDGRRNSSGPAGLNGLFTQSTSGYSMDHFVLGAAMTAAIRDHKVTSYFAGTIHAARVSKSLRYRANFVPAELTSDADTIALYDFSQGSGDILKDISGHGHDGKIIGATWVKPAENDSDAAAGTAEKEAVK